MPMAGAVLFVGDVGGMTRFYRHLAAMTVIHEDADHAVLEIGGFQLVIHALAGEAADARCAGSVAVREDSYIKLCLPVDSIAAARLSAAAHGGQIKSPEWEWEARGFRACDGHDPEGNVLQVREDAA